MLGKALYKILDEGKALEAVLTKDIQNALNLCKNKIATDVEKKEFIEWEESENEVENEEVMELEESKDDKQSGVEKQISEEAEIDENDE